MGMLRIFKSNKYQSIICRIYQKLKINDRKVKTIKFLFSLSIYYSLTTSPSIYTL